MIAKTNSGTGWFRTTDLNRDLNEAMKGGLKLAPEEAAMIREASELVDFGHESTVVVPIGVYGGYVEHNNRMANGVVIVSLGLCPGRGVTYRYCSFGKMYPEVG